MALVTLTDVKDRLFGPGNTVGTTHDAELTEMRATAISKVQDIIGGPIEQATVTGYFYGSVLLLPPNASSVVSVTPSGSTALEVSSYRLEHGMVRPTYLGSRLSGEYVVEYVAGWAAADVPARVNRAVIRHVKWQWSRDHGGSETYMPGGDDAVPGLGIDGIEKELRSILGDLATSAVIA